MIDLGGGYENSGWMSDRSLGGGQIVKNLGKSVLEQSGEEYAKGAAGRMVEKAVYAGQAVVFHEGRERGVQSETDARQLAADAATAALVEGSGYAARRCFDEFQLSEEDFDKAFERGYNAEEEWKGQNDQAIQEQIRSEPKS